MNDISRIIKSIHTKYDYDFSNYALSSFRRRISRVFELFGFDKIEDFLLKIHQDTEFGEVLVNEISVNVTELFRNPPFWVAIRDQVMPKLIENNKNITIWHNGCATGEEVFSMLIICKELGVEDRVNLIATDINQEVIDRARLGFIPESRFDMYLENYNNFGGSVDLLNYFKPVESGYQFDFSQFDKVKFLKHDLVKDEAPAKFHLVICRNVMIYFNQKLQNNVLRLIHGSMYKEGFLGIGSKESLIWCDYANRYEGIDDTQCIFKKVKD